MISRRFKRLVIALLLPLLVLRGMLPAGYMPVADASGLRIVMCSAGLAALSEREAGDSPSAPHQLPPNAGECAFALSAGNAPPVELVPLAAATVWTSSRTAADNRFVFPFSERPRAHPARGPPPAA